MNDLIQRLRDNAYLDEMEGCTPSVVALEREAAAELERLQARVRELEGGLSHALDERDRLSAEALVYLISLLNPHKKQD